MLLKLLAGVGGGGEARRCQNYDKQSSQQMFLKRVKEHFSQILSRRPMLETESWN